MKDIEINEENGWWYITLTTGENKSGIAVKKQDGETVEDVRKRLPELTRDYNRNNKWGN